jgi:hypothetical protein
MFRFSDFRKDHHKILSLTVDTKQISRHILPNSSICASFFSFALFLPCYIYSILLKNLLVRYRVFIKMPDHRSYQDPFYGWNTPKAISLCLQTLKECSSLPFEAIQKLISSRKKKQNP